MRIGEISSGTDLQCDKAFAPVQLAGPRPKPADLAGLKADGDWAFARGTRGQVFLVVALDAGAGLRRWSVPLTEVIDAADE